MVEPLIKLPGMIESELQAETEGQRVAMEGRKTEIEGPKAAIEDQKAALKRKDAWIRRLQKLTCLLSS